MRSFKRTLCLLLTVLMLVSTLFAVPVSAATVESGTCGENLKWKLDDKGVLTISGKGEMMSFEMEGAPWKELKFTKLVIRDGVTSISPNAFYFCKDLKTATLADSITAIDTAAFMKCESLSSVNIPEGVKKLDWYAFGYCTALTSITLPDSLEEIGYYAFYGSGLKSIALTKYVDLVQPDAFGACENLKKFTIDKKNPHYTVVDGILYDKAKTCVVCYPHGKAGEVILPDTVTSIEYGTFENCTGITSIRIPDGVTSIDYNAFYGCSGLTSITIPKSVEMIAENAFNGCTSLKSIKVDADNKNYSVKDGILYNKDKTVVVRCPAKKSGAVTLPKTVTSIGPWAFMDCAKMTSVKISEGVTGIHTMAFANCSKLSSITLPESLITIDWGTFNGCTSLSSITIPKNVRTVDSFAFENCSGLKKFKVDADNPYFTSVDGILYNKDMTQILICPMGKSGTVTIPDSVTEIGDCAFMSCTKLTSVTIPDSITDIAYAAFSGCTALGEIKLPETVKSIGTDAFRGCSNLEFISIPENVSNVGYYAFSLSGLKKIVFECGAPQYYEYSEPFVGVKATVYYPKENTTWTSEVRERLAVSSKVKWKSYKSGEMPWAAPLEITTQPKTTYTAIGDKAKFTVKAEGDGLTYQWYYKDVDGSQYKKASGTKATYSLEMTEARRDRKLYCVVTDRYGRTEKTKTVTMKMAASITTQPKTTYTQLGEKAKVKVKAVGEDLTYQWYYKDTDSSKYKKSSNTSATYSAEMTEARKDRKVYCVVTDKKGNEVKSKTVTLKLAASIKTEPKSVKTSIGKKAKFTVQAVGDDLKYQWYYKDVDGKTYKKASCTKATYTTELTKARNGRKFYCVVTDKYGNTVKSKTVSMKKK